jgi:YD repeat-containing protein
VTSGTKTVTVSNKAGNTTSTTSYDYPANTLIDQTTYGNFDERLRHRLVTYLDGTTTSMVYDCCGLQSSTDRDGVTTSYSYDSLGRLFTSTRLSIMTTYSYDNKGNVYKAVRTGTDASQIQLYGKGYDAFHRVLTETNALNYVTTHAYTVDGSGQQVHTATAPDTGTRIETRYKDGQLAKVNGTGARGVRYDYGKEQDGTPWRAYTKEIKLDAAGSDTSEWVKTYADTMGRAYKTIYPDGAYAQSFYKTTTGQLWKQRDADDVRTLFQYTSEGELEYTVADLDKDDVMDLAGTDRITRTVNDVISNYSTTVRRTQTYRWITDGTDSPLLVSKVETAVDGLRTWDTAYRDGSTPVVSTTRTVYSGGGNRYVTNTAPNGAFTLIHYLNGRLNAETRKDSAAAQVGQTSYQYDPHGRQWKVTDARNGTTVFAYDNADQATSVTSPAPGSGQAAQVTTTS